MKKYLHAYLHNLLQAGIGLDFASVSCRYTKFTMYCIIGPEENILQITFAPARHEHTQKQLKSLHRKVRMRRRAQEKFHYDDMFAAYFAGRLASFPFAADSPLIAAGTDFQKSVWRQIAAIPYGSCITYKQLAQAAGSPRGSRAAAMACGANPMAVIIPCHRVVAVNGPGGFTGGVAVKKALLALEYEAALR